MTCINITRMLVDLLAISIEIEFQFKSVNIYGNIFPTRLASRSTAVLVD